MIPNFLIARLGELVSDRKNEDIIRHSEQQVRDWQQYAKQLERRLDGLAGDHRELGSNALRVVEIMKSLEQDRNQLPEQRDSLQRENGRLREMIADLREKRDRFRTEATDAQVEIVKLTMENAKILTAYGRAKGALSTFNDCADATFRADFLAKLREKFDKFVKSLP